MLFLASHAAPRSFDVVGDACEESGFALGDQGLRYLFSCGCRVLAHGPTECSFGDPAEGWDYRLPQCFACPTEICPECAGYRVGSPTEADTCERRNVFLGMGRFLAPGLRMMCAGCSNICSGDARSATREFWAYASGGDFQDPIAEAFLSAIALGPKAVPLCISRGGSEPSQSPLLNDFGFDASPNPWGGEGYLHIAYPVWPEQRRGVDIGDPMKVRLILENGKTVLPVLQVHRTELGSAGYKEPLSGSRARRGAGILDRRTEWRSRPLTETPQQFVQKAVADLALILELEGTLELSQGWRLTERYRLSQARELRLDLTRDPAAVGVSDQSKSSPDNAIRSFVVSGRAEGRRVIEFLGAVETAEALGVVPILGDGGRFQVEVDPYGQVSALSITWRRIAGSQRSCRLCRPSRAQRLAESRLPTGDGCSGPSERDRYQEIPERFEFGFKEEGWHVNQVEMTPVYRFSFRSPGAVCPIRTLEVDACDPDCENVSENFRAQTARPP